ncbi:inositolphosphotransferase PWA37_003682 [Arxiozyma heterogenica]|uniref:inositolphosphotransferase n=1 Tax=Arxiozyma heterogenica TaxID=278026 RepID=UPI002F0D42AE
MVRVLKYCHFIIIRLVKAAFNQRNIITLPIEFILNFSLIFIWLNLFSYAKYIPTNIRPAIHSKFAFLMDSYLFGDTFKELNAQYNVNDLSILSIFTSSTFTIICLLLIPLSVWYYVYYIRKLKYNLIDWYDHIFHFENINNVKRLRLIVYPYLIPFLSFTVLNILHLFTKQETNNFSKTKDLLAWTSYVILHITVPILTAIYLYLFHVPGVVKYFSLSLGIQNLLGIFTHLVFPTASPWFTHLYGINDVDHVNYEQEGFAAGLVRVDKHLGTHLNTNGFHQSPIVFGAVPSLHSAIAFQCFLFIMTRASSLKNRFSSSNEILPLDDEQSSTVSSSPSSSTPSSPFSESFDYARNQLPNPIVPSLSSSTSSLSLTKTSSMFSSDEETTHEVREISKCQIDEKIHDLEQSVNNLASENPLNYVKLYEFDQQFANSWRFIIFNKGLIAKMLISGYIILQWWTTMYLDHHYRFDLFVGMLYSLLTFIIMNIFFMQPKVMKPWIEVRLGERDDVKNESRTFGMRVFQGSRYEWFFDPLA